MPPLMHITYPYQYQFTGRNTKFEFRHWERYNRTSTSRFTYYLVQQNGGMKNGKLHQVVDFQKLTALMLTWDVTLSITIFGSKSNTSRHKENSIWWCWWVPLHSTGWSLTTSYNIHCGMGMLPIPLLTSGVPSCRRCLHTPIWWNH